MLPTGGVSASSLLEVRGASKSYPVKSLKDLLLFRAPRRVQALRDVSIELQAGQIVALLGPNGAGKTTLINIICDLTRADSGSVNVAGVPVPHRSLEAQRLLGLVTTNDRSFFWRLTGRQNLEFFAALQGMPRRLARAGTREMLERFGLPTQADRFFNTYSAGMKKRLGLARALLHDPLVLLMDEPTNGLDAEAMEDLITLVKHEVRAAGKCVLWATHRVEEVERLCDRVIVLSGGRIRFDGGIDVFRERCTRRSGFEVEARVRPDQREQILALARSHGAEANATTSEDYIELSGIDDESRLSRVLAGILEGGGLVRRVERRADPLHEVFLQLTRDDGTSS
jgi:ABC-2 type transport system ATP-binding protein